MSVGVVFPPADGVESLAAYARAAEAAGLDDLWLWEDCFGDGGVVAATVALTATTRIAVATGILPVPLRNVAVLAMEAAALERLAPGRLLLGVGHGVQAWMAQAGVRAASPLTLLREHVIALRGLLAGERLSVSGDYVRLDGVSLDHPPTEPPPVWVAGEGPKTLELAGSLGDGVILTAGTSPSGAADAVEGIARGRRASGRIGPPRVAAFVMAVFADTPDAVARARARLERAADDWGLAADARSGVTGTPADVARQVRDWTDAGVTRVVLLPVADDDRGAFLGAAGEVARLVADRRVSG